MTGGRKPTHNLCLGVSEEDGTIKWRQLGVGWVNENGAISISLNECTVISQRDIAAQGDRLFLFSVKDAPWRKDQPWQNRG